MSFINRKDENGNYVISNEELRSLIKQFNKKYHLAPNSYECDCKYTLNRNKYGVDCVVGTYLTESGPIYPIDETCTLTDFDFVSIHVYEENDININKDYRRFMYSKFGDEYLKALKQFKKQEKEHDIKLYADERNEQYQNEVDIL